MKPAETTPLHDRIKALRDALTEGLYEKEEAVRLALLTAIAGESIFFLGAPGCAKSMIARRIVNAFKTDGADGGANNDVQNVQYFEYLMNQFSTPEDIFGPISLKALNGEGKSGKEEYKRITEKMLPEADIAFLDEIWKASPAIQNTLLTIINEKKFHNGNEIVSVPLKALLAASNELPARGRGLEALYDRFILRLPVNFIQSESTFFEMISQPSSSEFELSDETRAFQITNDELKEWKGKIDEVRLSAEARNVISAIRKEMTAENAKLSEEEKKNGELFEVGDRRWKKIAHILKAAAFLNGRTEIDLMDCQLIEYCIWNTEAQQEKAKAIVEKCIRQNGLGIHTQIDEINEYIKKYEDYVSSSFYVVGNSEPLVYQMSDGWKAYAFKTPCIIRGHGYYGNSAEVSFLCGEIVTRNARMASNGGRYYDSKKQRLDMDIYHFDARTILIQGEKITWSDANGREYEAEIQMTKGVLVPDQNVFGHSDFLTLRQDKADKDYYNPILGIIKKELDRINEFIKSKKDNFQTNIFARESMCSVILSSVEQSRRELEDVQVALDKQRKRYKL